MSGLRRAVLMLLAVFCSSRPGGAGRGHAARPHRLRQGARALACQRRRPARRARAQGHARGHDPRRPPRRRAAELTAAEAHLAATEASEPEARRRVARLRARLAEVRAQLAELLRERYMGDRPDLVTVVLQADGFPQLLETLTFLKRVQRADTRILDLVRDARGDAGPEQRELMRLAARAGARRAAVRARRDALASIAAGLRERRDTLARAHAARVAALARTRSRRRTGRARAHAPARRARPRRARPSGSGGPWAIPWPIVQCESGGQNLPPNSAGASGYYQFMQATWRGLGGSTPHAYQASKAEQDRLAAQLWAGGAGRRNWVCADLV